jgi:hypothetical protein
MQSLNDFEYRNRTEYPLESFASFSAPARSNASMHGNAFRNTAQCNAVASSLFVARTFAPLCDTTGCKNTEA